jgi:hypothetical protein
MCVPEEAGFVEQGYAVIAGLAGVAGWNQDAGGTPRHRTKQVDTHRPHGGCKLHRSKARPADLECIYASQAPLNQHELRSLQCDGYLLHH